MLAQSVKLTHVVYLNFMISTCETVSFLSHQAHTNPEGAMKVKARADLGSERGLILQPGCGRTAGLSRQPFSKRILLLLKMICFKT